MFDPIFLDDLEEAFAPLIEYAKSVVSDGSAFHKFIDRFMYVYSDESHSWFKDVDTRKYLKLPRIGGDSNG